MARLKEEVLRLRIEVSGHEGRKQIEDLRQAIEADTRSIKKNKEELASLERLQMKNTERYKALKSEIVLASKRIDENKAKITNLRRALDASDMTVGELRQEIKELNAALKDLDPHSERFEELSSRLNKCKAQLRELSSGQIPATQSVLQRLWKSSSGAVAIMQAGISVIRRFASAIRGAFDTIKDFEQANTNLATILGVNVNEIADLTAEAERLGRTTSYTAAQVTELQTELAKLGFNKAQIMDMEESVLHFASAVGADLADAASLAGATLRMFGLRSKDTEDTLAALALSTNKSALNFSYLETAMSIVGPVARTFGFGVKDTTALLGALANSGFDASSAATATRNIFLKLADSNGDLARSLGGPVKSFDELIDGLVELNARGIDLGKTLELTDKRSVAAFNAFLRGAESAAELRGELDLTDGVLEGIASERMDTVEGALLELKSAYDGFILSLKNSRGPIKTAIRDIKDFILAITPKDKAAPDMSNVSARIHEYVASYWRQYVQDDGGTEKIYQIINEDEKAIEAKLKDAEARLKGASGILAKNRAKALIKEYREGLAVIQGARDELSDRISWETGDYHSEDRSNDSNPGGGDDKKGKKTWSLNSDKAFLQAKAELTRQFNEGEIKSQEELEEHLYQLEVSSYKGRLAQHKETGEARAKIEADMAKTTMDYNEKVKKKQEEVKKKVQELEKQALQTYISVTEDHEKRAEAQVRAEDARYQEEKKQYESKKQYIANYQQVIETLERQHQNNLRKIRQEAFDAEQKDLENDHKIRLAKIEALHAYELAVETTSSIDKLKHRKEVAKKTAEENFRYLFEQMKVLDKIVSAGEVNGSKLSEEQLRQYELKAEQVRKLFREATAEVEKYSEKSGEQIRDAIFAGTGTGSLFGVSQSDWETLFFNIEKGTFGAQDLQTALAGIGGAAQEGMKLASKAISVINAREKKEFDEWSKHNDEKKSALEKRLNAGLVTQAQYNAEVERMEKDKQAREEQMALEQAERQKAMSIVQAIINTALGVTQTLAQWGVPAGIAPAAIMAALGAAEIAMIAAQPVGYAEGGEVKVERAQDGRQFRAQVDPDKRGYVDRPTVLVGEEGGEYVIPAEGLENPSVRPFINTIENARRSGQLRNLRLEAVSPAMVVNAKARGGYMTGTRADSQSPDVSLSQVQVKDSRLTEAIERLVATLDAGIDARVAMLGREGIVEKLKEYDRMKNLGKLG